MKKIICYHHNDHDGIVAAAIINNANINCDIEFRMVDYTMDLGLENINEKEVDIVYFLDYSFSNEENYKKFIDLNRRFSEAKKDIIWIDHHKTSIEKDNHEIRGIRNGSYCAAVLTWLWCHMSANDINDILSGNIDIIELKQLPSFLIYIDDYDCWKMRFDVSNDIHYGFNETDPCHPMFTQLLYDQNNGNLLIDRFITRGSAVRDYLKENDKLYHIDMYGFEVKLFGFTGFALNRKGNSLMFGEETKRYHFVMPFYFNGTMKKWTYSLFTEKDNIDLEWIASKFGGGGHKKAAGFQTKKCIFESVTEITEDNMQEVYDHVNR